MTIRKIKKIRQLASGQGGAHAGGAGRGKVTNTEGQVGEAEIMC